MKGGQLQEQVKEKTYGSALMQVNICDLRNIMLSFPSVDEQKEIADKLDVLSTKMQRLVSAYQRKLGALEALKQSILHQAFTGKL
jgi:type I restriction enzyme S subunit